MFDSTVTLFNRKHDKSGDIWYPHVITGVELEKDKAALKAKYGAEASDSAMLVINCEYSGDSVAIGGIPYLPPKQWDAQDEDALAGSITLNPSGQYFDFFIEGDYGSEEAMSDSDYQNGFYSYMDSAYDYCFAITGVGGPYSLIPHFKVLAK